MAKEVIYVAVEVEGDLDSISEVRRNMESDVALDNVASEIREAVRRAMGEARYYVSSSVRVE